eukprot:CAMPEP_0201581268 /NCGR_PEP_ID=MMETSP0190_2-20130828/65319_1 /ASSEMBLY_ACC=CAM_ASM_000263 /TAXON_ID=37353 /ORGANISM="Rosalina sp." /LENGTH=173 /DNA_ID=CAMNT_0048018857 /DNA_START=10 /DNA_END=531 /DNA_ORIENTATION=+
MAHQAHPSLANLAARKRVSTFKPSSNATWAKIQEKNSLAELDANKVVTGNIDYFKNHPNYNIQEEPIIKSNKSGVDKQSKHKKANKNNGMELDMKAMKQMIEEQKQQEMAKENKASSEPIKEEKKPIPLDSPFSIDFNSPQMIGLTDQMANLFTEEDKTGNVNVNGDGTTEQK